jgi:CRP-like cAMP-binding protein
MQIAEALTLHRRASDSRAEVVPAEPPVASTQPTLAVPPEALRRFPLFAAFTLAELRRLLSPMRRWEVSDGAVLCAEGSAGGSCFVILDGAVDISIRAAGRQQLLATLPAGSLFGQMSLIENTPRSATCSARGRAVILELDHGPCEAILQSRSPIALKLLGALNEGLIAALRGADRRLMQLESAALNGRAAPVTNP